MGFVLKTALGTKSRTVDSLDVCCPLDKYHLHLLINTFPHPVHKLARGVTFRHHFYLDYWQEGRWERNRGVAALFLTHLPIYIHIYIHARADWMCWNNVNALLFSIFGVQLIDFYPNAWQHHWDQRKLEIWECRWRLKDYNIIQSCHL